MSNEQFYRAIAEDRVEFAEALLKETPGIDVNAFPCLHVALPRSNMRTVEVLLSHGADVNRDFSLGTPLFACFRHDYGDKKIVERLLDAGADPNKGSSYYNHDTPLFAISNENFSKADLLIKRGADVNITNEKGESLVMRLVSSNDLDILNWVFKSGKCTTINYIDPSGYTALLIAVEKDFQLIAESLLKHGADPSIPTPSGRSLLDIASPKIKKALAKALVKKQSATGSEVAAASSRSYFSLFSWRDSSLEGTPKPASAPVLANCTVENRTISAADIKTSSKNDPSPPITALMPSSDMTTVIASEDWVERRFLDLEKKVRECEAKIEAQQTIMLDLQRQLLTQKQS